VNKAVRFHKGESQMGKLNEIFSGTFMVLLIIAYFGSLPLAIIFGDKWDVVISLFIPTYGFWVMLGAVL
ncbi:MAG: hypothetical protein PVJ68_10000, partial [Candidatus Thiodiazotropha sp.]